MALLVGLSKDLNKWSALAHACSTHGRGTCCANTGKGLRLGTAQRDGGPQEGRAATPGYGLLETLVRGGDSGSGQRIRREKSLALRSEAQQLPAAQQGRTVNSSPVVAGTPGTAACLSKGLERGQTHKRSSSCSRGIPH